MRIIVDGNDGVGKTSLVEILKDEFNIKSYIHLSNKDPRDFNFYDRLLEKDNVIFDRSFLDEIIYSEVLERESKITLEQVDQLITKAKELGFIFIICHTKSNNYNKNENIKIIKNKKKIDSYFKNITKKYDLKYYDTFNESIIDLLKYLERIVEERNEKLY